MTTILTPHVTESKPMVWHDARFDLDTLIGQHQEMLVKILHDAEHEPMTHVNPYVILELIRQQSMWLLALEQRLRAFEEAI